MTIFEAKQQLHLDIHIFQPASERYVIYFLLDNHEIVYVGKSSDKGYLNRIRNHRKDKVFDSYAIATTNLTETKCLEFETSLISLIQPKYNKKDSFFNINRIVQGVSAYYDANNLSELPATEQESKARRSYLRASFFVALVCVLFLAQAILIQFFGIKNDFVGLCTMAAMVFLAIYGHAKKYRYEKIMQRNIELGIS